MLGYAAGFGIDNQADAAEVVADELVGRAPANHGAGTVGLVGLDAEGFELAVFAFAYIDLNTHVSKITALIHHVQARQNFHISPLSIACIISVACPIPLSISLACFSNLMPASRSVFNNSDPILSIASGSP